MKKLYLYALLMCCCNAAMSQTEKGTWLIGGNFNLNTSDNTTSIGINPTAGYFVINNLAVGGTMMLEFEKFGENKTTTFGIGPLARYYFGARSVKPFVDGELNFVSQKLKVANVTNTENGINYFLGMGLAMFLNQNVALEVLAGYDHTKLKDRKGDGGFAMRAGFQVYLHPK